MHARGGKKRNSPVFGLKLRRLLIKNDDKICGNNMWISDNMYVFSNASVACCMFVYVYA